MRAEAVWIKERQYRFLAPTNPELFYVNCRLYTIKSRKGTQAALMGAVLNSTPVSFPSMYGRPVGVEANWSTMVSGTNMLLVPDWNLVTEKQSRRLKDSFAKLKGRRAMGLLSAQRLRRQAMLASAQISQLQALSDVTEFDQEDRRELDDAVLELLGIKDAKARSQLREQLYAYLEDYFEAARRKEETAIDNKKVAKRKDKITPQSLASDVFTEIENNHPALLKGYSDLVKPDGEIPVEGVRIPHSSKAEILHDMLTVGVLLRQVSVARLSRHAQNSKHGLF